MRLGALDKTVDLQAPPASGVGQSDANWTTYATVPALVAPVVPGNVQGQKVWTVYRDDIEPHHRVLYGARRFDVFDVNNPKQRNQELVLYCTEPEPFTEATLRTYSAVYDPATGTNTLTPSDEPVQATIGEYTEDELGGGLVEQGDLKATIPAWGLVEVPTTAASLVFDGDEWSVASVKPIYDRGVVWKFELQIRK